MTDYPFEIKHPTHWNLIHLHGLNTRLHATHAQFQDPRLDAKVSWSERRHRKGRRVKVITLPEPRMSAPSSMSHSCR